MQRMDGKDRCDEGAAPQTKRHLLEQKKKADVVDAVQQHVNEMMRAWPWAKKSVIPHVRHRCQRMPVVRMNMGKGPTCALPIEASQNFRVFADVSRIVVVDEVVVQRLAENRPGHRD